MQVSLITLASGTALPIPTHAGRLEGAYSTEIGAAQFVWWDRMSVDWVDWRVNRSIGMPSAGAAGALDVGIWACSPKGLVLLWSCNATCSIE